MRQYELYYMIKAQQSGRIWSNIRPNTVYKGSEIWTYTAYI